MLVLSPPIPVKIIGELMKRTRLLATFAIVLVFCSSLRAQVLDQVPEQALLVFKVSNLQGFSTKFGKFATDLQLVTIEPKLADPLGALTEQLGIKNGLDKAGEAGFVFVDPAVTEGNDDQSMMM